MEDVAGAGGKKTRRAVVNPDALPGYPEAECTRSVSASWGGHSAATGLRGAENNPERSLSRCARLEAWPGGGFGRGTGVLRPGWDRRQGLQTFHPQLFRQPLRPWGGKRTGSGDRWGCGTKRVGFKKPRSATDYPWATASVLPQPSNAAVWSGQWSRLLTRNDWSPCEQGCLQQCLVHSELMSSWCSPTTSVWRGGTFEFCGSGSPFLGALVDVVQWLKVWWGAWSWEY